MAQTNHLNKFHFQYFLPEFNIQIAGILPILTYGTYRYRKEQVPSALKRSNDLKIKCSFTTDQFHGELQINTI